MPQNIRYEHYGLDYIKERKRLGGEWNECFWGRWLVEKHIYNKQDRWLASTYTHKTTHTHYIINVEICLWKFTAHSNHFTLFYFFLCSVATSETHTHTLWESERIHRCQQEKKNKPQMLVRNSAWLACLPAWEEKKITESELERQKAVRVHRECTDMKN